MYLTSSDAFEDYGPPTNFVDLGSKAFMRNLDAIKGEYKNEGNKSKYHSVLDGYISSINIQTNIFCVLFFSRIDQKAKTTS